MNERNDPKSESAGDAEAHRRAVDRALKYARAHGATVEENVSVFGGPGEATVMELPKNAPPEVKAELERLIMDANSGADLDVRFAAALEYARTHGAFVEDATPHVRIGWPEDAPPEVLRRFEAILAGDAARHP